MATLRFKALDEISRRELIETKLSDQKISGYFGADVFDRETMRQYIAKDAYESLCNAIDEGRRIDRKFANQIAQGMKTWAMERGATHYSHWFQPLNDSTAEKHDAFFEPMQGGGSFETFKGELLVQQEPDASSFPNGGLRNTFEARGYSAWDPSSPAFIIDKTLCIPSIFIAYTGEALDFKTPLLKSLQVVCKAAEDVCQYFDKDVKKVNVTLGWEQEYFLVDEALFLARPDLMQTGRTLMGHIAAKDQQLDDHYFGAIPSRVLEYMKEFEEQAYRLGIPIKTRHNEVAPNQFECAPMFEEANIAVDHNTLLMTVMRKVALKHKLRVLFHEKPFAGVNGSGKHCNWSMMTDTGVNLLAPGKTPKNNIQFLTFFVNAIKAAHDYGTLFMASIATQSNSHRLGAHEAPPAVMSVFAGSTLSDMLDSIEERVSDKKMTPDEKTDIKLDIGKIPDILLDNTDRNRTSPFAFTGNRFEFRAVGSSDNCADAMLTLNTAVAEQLTRFKEAVDRHIENGMKKEKAIYEELKKLIRECKPIHFDGNGYSDEWKAEAARRGLDCETSTPLIFDRYLTADSIRMFESTGVLNKVEIEARTEVKWETYTKKIQIEGRVLGDLTMNHIVPIASRYEAMLLDKVYKMAQIGGLDASADIDLLKKIQGHTAAIQTLTIEMIEARKKANRIENARAKAIAYHDTVEVYFEEIRRHIDKLEEIIDDQMWTLPKYRELLFIK